MKMCSLKNYKVLLLAIFLVFTMGCITPEDEESEEETNQDSEETKKWSDGLTRDQVISAMPITVTDDTISADGEDDGIGVKKLAQTDGTEIKYLSLVWFLPFLWTGDDLEWKVWQKNDDGEWSLVDVTIDVEELTDGEYKYSTLCGVPLVGQKIVYFKVQLVDHNGGEYESTVSFFVYPNDRKLRITLAEVLADAPSKLYVGYQQWFWLWDVHDTGLPAVKVVEEDLSAWTTVLFMMQVDFSGFSFGVDQVTRKSNTSWCKAENVTPPDDAEDVDARVRYSFEDLPIEALATEPTGYFDYNDLKFYFDILNPEAQID